MTSKFFAMLHRMRYIKRWGLMHNTETENIQEHSMEVAIIAHALATLRCKLFSEARVCPDPEHVVVLALFHDVTEVLTGDLPTPIKYYNEKIRENYQSIETAAADHLLSLLPEFLQDVYQPLLKQNESMDVLEKESHLLVKAADRLSAYIKCIDEENAGNREFSDAKQSTELKLKQMQLPEVDWFLTEIIPAYHKTIDQQA